MAKTQEKVLARQHRKAGRSIKGIARLLGVSSSSVSLWCQDIRLTAAQMTALDAEYKKKRTAALLKGARMNHEKKLGRIAFHQLDGRKKLSRLTRRELLCAGLGLYWGEGVKKGNTAVVNSDPKAILFAMRWFTDALGVARSDLRPRLFINHIHAKRVPVILAFWAKTLRLPRSQFANPVLIRRRNRKVYENYESYYGVLALRVRKATDLKYRILGLMDALAEAEVAQVVRASHS